MEEKWEVGGGHRYQCRLDYPVVEKDNDTFPQGKVRHHLSLRIENLLRNQLGGEELVLKQGPLLLSKHLDGSCVL